MMNRREALTALMALPATPAVTRTQIGPADVLVLECPGAVRDEEVVMMRRYLEDAFPGVKAIILSDGLKLSVMRPRA